MNIVIEIEGGMVQRVIVDEPFTGNVMVLDRDDTDEDSNFYSTTWEGRIEPVEAVLIPHVVSQVIKEWEVV